jgi:hypothetical protein
VSAATSSTPPRTIGVPTNRSKIGNGWYLFKDEDVRWGRCERRKRRKQKVKRRDERERKAFESLRIDQNYKSRERFTTMMALPSLS